MNKHCKTIVSIALTLLMLASVCVVPAFATVSGDLNSLNNQMGEVQERMAELQTQIEDLGFQQQSVMEKKAALDEKNALAQEELDIIAEQIAILDNYAANREADLEAARANEAKQEELWLNRLRAMEEGSKLSYVAALFKAGSLSNLLTLLDAIKDISQYDKDLCASYLEARKNVETLEAEAKEMTELNEEKKAEYEQKKVQLAADIDAACALIATIQEDIDAYQELMQEEEAKEAELSEAIAQQLAAYYAAQISAAAVQQAARSTGAAVYVSGGGGTTLLWPSWSTMITSYYGPRESPGGIGSTNHKGIDISGSNIAGTDVWNAGSGTVIASGYDSSRGNYVTVAMDNGYTATYMHLSDRYVSEGQYIEQGESVGPCGTTGNSTGYHIDFRIQDSNGDYVDPTSFDYVYAD